jgi:hypothetical protein
MAPYLILLALVLAITSAASYGNPLAHRLPRLLALIVTATILVSFAGVRHWTVGSDGENYLMMLRDSKSMQDIWTTTEIGFNAVLLLSASVSNNYMLLFFSISLIVVSNYLIGIKAFFNRVHIPILVFLAFGYYTMFFNVARQGIAVSICFLALIWLVKRRPFPYLVAVAVAVTFHHTAIVALPLYFMALPRTSWSIFLPLGIISVVISVFLPTIVAISAQLLDSKYSVYAEVSEASGQLMVAFIITQGLFFAIVQKHVLKSAPVFARLLNIYLLSFVPAVATLATGANPSGFLRFSMYFSHTAILLWPMVLGSIRNRLAYLFAVFLFMVFAAVFFVSTTSTFGNLVPFTVNEDTPW